MELVTDMNQVPAFETEAEEAEFWSTHAFAEHLLSADQASDVLPPTRQPKSTPVSLRLGRELEQRLRTLAKIKGTSYQTLLKEFVLERVYEEEKRHHLI